MTKNQSRKSWLAFLFALICLPVAVWAQATLQSKGEDGPVDKVVFRDTFLKTVLATFGKHLGVKFVYDEAVKDTRVSIELNDVTLKAAVKALLAQQNLQARLIEAGTVIILQNDEASRKRYEQYEAWPTAAAVKTAASGKEDARQNIVFKGASMKAALAVLIKQYRMEVTFDEGIKDSRISLELNDVTAKFAAKTILDEQKLQARLIEENKVVIFPDTEANRKLYQKDKVWPEQADKQ